MITWNENRFNCSESVLIRVSKELSLPGFDEDVMRLASNFGGGVGGWGSVCGAVSGASMAMGLLLGTEGDEEPEEFLKKREHMRALTKEFMRAFEVEWGYVNCLDLIGIDFRSEPGATVYEGMKARGETHCGEYVEWAAEKVLEIIKENL